METILLVGKTGDLFNNIHDCLSEKFYVQYGSERPETLAGVLKFTDPGMVMICLHDLKEEHGKIFEMINERFPNLPVVTVGTFAEHENFHSYESDPRYDILLLPTTNPLVIEKAEEALAKSSELRARSSGKKKILVVDDDGLSLRTIKGILDELYEVSVVNSGAKALASMGINRPDLVVLDYEMPGCDGRKTLSMIRAEAAFKDVPVIFLTGISDRWHIQAVLELQPAGYLLKPPNPKLLLDKIADVLKEGTPE